MDKYNLVFESCVKLGSDIWFSSCDYNGLYRYNLCDKNVERILNFPNEKQKQECLYYEMCKYRNKLIFIPCWANHISIFDLESSNLEQIEIPRCYKQNKVYHDFMEAAVYYDSLYLIGCTYPGIIKVNLETHEIIKVYELKEKNAKRSEGIYFGSKIVQTENYLYIPCCYKNAILLYDMKTDKVSYFEIGEKLNQYTQIVKDNQKFYLITRNTNEVFLWDEEVKESIKLNVNFKKKYRDALLRISEKFVWAISIISCEIFQINKLDHEVCCIELQQNMNVEFAAACETGLFLLDGFTGKWYFVSNKGTLSDLKIKMKEPRTKKEVWESFEKERINEYENRIYSIQYFLFQVLDKNGGINKNRDKLIDGNKIWNALRC